MINYLFEHVLNQLIDFAVHNAGEHIEGIVLFGSAARTNAFIPGWSDVDAVIVVRDMLTFHKLEFRQFLESIRKRTGIGFSLAILSESEVCRRFERVSPFNCIVLNALSGRHQCGRLAMGRVDFIEPPGSIEAANVKVYLDHSVSQIRRLLIEPKSLSDKERLAQLIRWCSSHLRAWLRLHGRFVLPYEPTIHAAREIADSSVLDVFQDLFKLRYSWKDMQAEQLLEHLQLVDDAFERLVFLIDATPSPS
jgi:predicted nucleotidyltransferase